MIRSARRTLARVVTALCTAVGGAAAQEAAASNGRTVRLGGRALYFEESGQGVPVVLLHGFGSSATFWRDHLIDSLATTYRVIAVDLPGHGRSDALDTSIVFRNENAARVILALLDTLRIERAAFVGFSQGGMISTYVAVLAPTRVSALAVIGSQAYYSAELRAVIERGGPDSTKDALMARYTARHGATRAMQLARQFWHFRLIDGDPALTPDRLGRIQAPALVIHGDDDFVPVSQAWYLYSNLRDAHLWIVPHGGHFPFPGTAGRRELSGRLMSFLASEWKDAR